MTSTSVNWSCIKGCGACCKLAPDERVEAIEVLTDTQVKEYFDLVGTDGWCKFFDRSSKICRIYEDRPDFCKVRNIAKAFKVNKAQFDSFAIECCREQIRSIYGGRSRVMKRFNNVVRKINQ